MKVEKFKTLYTVDAKKQIREWRISVHQNKDGTAIIKRVHGILGGQQQVNLKPVTKGKNIGRANETTPLEQALSEAKSMWLKQKDHGYVDYMPDPNDPPKTWLPMKAKRWHNYSHKIKYPAFIQPKLNGVRSLIEIADDGRVIIHSGGNKTYTVLKHIEKSVRKLIKDPSIILDGEIYRHGWPINKIVSRAKKKHADTEELGLWVFDIAMLDMPFSKRFELIKKIISPKTPAISIVPTFKVESAEDVDRYYDRFIKQKYEGAMIRNANGLYRFGYRSYDILKRPEYLRQEFKIIGVKEGKGLDKGCAIFVCVHKGKPFEVRPQGTVAERKAYLRNFNSIKGKMATVKFKEFTEYGIPHCATMEVIRDYE